MSWGASYFYYHCPVCGKKYKYETSLISKPEIQFGCCPRCGADGVYEKDGACIPDDLEYEEADSD